MFHMFNLNGIYATIAAVVISTTGGVYVTYKYQKNYYEAKISKAEADYAKAIAKKQEDYDKAIGRYIENVRNERNRVFSLEQQLRQIVSLGDGGNGACRVSYGFIRLFNASATGETTEPTRFDATSSSIDLTTVLSTILDNNRKYREAMRQVDAIIEAQK